MRQNSSSDLALNLRSWLGAGGPTSAPFAFTSSSTSALIQCRASTMVPIQRFAVTCWCAKTVSISIKSPRAFVARGIRLSATNGTLRSKPRHRHCEPRHRVATAWPLRAAACHSWLLESINGLLLIFCVYDECVYV